MTHYEWLQQKIEYLRQNPTQDCVEWPFRSGHRYRNVVVNKKTVSVHRVAYELYHHMAPSQWVLHSCNNPICFNPAHLRDGSRQDNIADMRKAGSHTRMGQRKLDVNRVKEILYMLERGYRVTAIARIFGVTFPTIIDIRDGNTWRHVPRP